MACSAGSGCLCQFGLPPHHPTTLLPPAVQPNDRGAVRVRCDDKLRELFQVDGLDLARMSEALKPHLTPPPPVTLQYTIRWGAPLPTP